MRSSASGKTNPYWLLGAIRNYFILSFAVWTAVLALLAVWDARKIREFTLRIARNEALANYNKDVAFRDWATSHGGVYVPVDEGTPPNPYLRNIPERDITTPSGKRLTLMNPAYMARQLNTHFAKSGRIFGHITSLNLKNPINTPDQWEAEALAAFERGGIERLELADIFGKPYLRLMRPIITKQGCLKCHGDQGYKVGQIRGGVSVSVPMEFYYSQEREEGRRHLAVYIALWALGSLGLFAGFRSAKKLIERKEQAEAERAEAARALVETNKMLTREIEERKITEEALREREERYRQMFHLNRAVKLLIDPATGAIVDANQSATDFYGYSRDTLRKMNIKQINTLPPEQVEAEMKLAKEEKRLYFNFKHRRADGSVCDVEVYSGPISVGGTTLLHSIVHDISERKKFEESLLRSNEELRQFAHIASHDLREPLRSITGFLQLLAMRYKDKLDADANEFIGFATDGAKRMDALINSLLDYSRATTGNTQLERVDSAKAFGDALENLRNAVEESGAVVHVGALPAVVADPAQLVQLFQNLLANAIKFMPAGKKPGIEVSAAPKGTFHEFRMKDNGIGMESRNFERIFKMFGRIHPPGEYPGRGIGLAVCKKIVERHGGEIGVTSTPGEGSTFHFTLPKAD